MEIVFYSNHAGVATYQAEYVCQLTLPDGQKAEAKVKADRPREERDTTKAYLEALRQLMKKIDEGKPTFEDAAKVVADALSDATIEATRLETNNGEQKTAETLLIQQSNALVLAKISHGLSQIRK